ncbi:MAG TPA: hypothetical protein VH088_24065 [Terriglobales bacterium]|jgi:hypothetical protein|nr:hypothetical protein [Terriglobales bacterium]
MESLLSWPTEDAAEYRRTDIVRWWEARRLHFNVYVGVVGVITWFLVLIAGSAAVKPGDDFEEPFAMFLGPVIYAFIANACYALGWIADTRSPSPRNHGAGRIPGFGSDDHGDRRSRQPKNAGPIFARSFRSEETGSTGSLGETLGKLSEDGQNEGLRHNLRHKPGRDGHPLAGSG